MMRVSIVTPSFNQAAFLQQTIESVLSQDYPDMEYIVMDGGSTDGSVGILKEYSERLAYWVSEKDGGQADAVNRGWRRATGDVLAYINSDDMYEAGAVRRAVSHLQSHSDVDFVYGVCNSLMPSGEIRKYDPPPYNANALVENNFIPQPTVFFRRRALETIGYLDETYRYCLDYDYWLRAAAAGMRFAKLEGEPLACFRFWLGSKTSANAAAWTEECVRAQTKAYKSLSHSPPDKSYLQAKALVAVSYGFAVAGNSQLARQGLTQAIQSSPRVALGLQFWRATVRCFRP